MSAQAQFSLDTRKKRFYFTLEKANRDVSKLAKKVIIDKNGHKRTVYIKMGIKSNTDRKVMTQVELQNFTDETIKDKKAPYKWIKIGNVCNDAQKRIEQKCGVKISGIHMDNSGVIHALTQSHHNLEPNDLLHAVDVINSTTDIELSQKQHLSNNVLIFKKDIDGEIIFLTEVHVKNDYLLVFDAWRQKKARRYPNAT